MKLFEWKVKVEGVKESDDRFMKCIAHTAWLLQDHMQHLEKNINKMLAMNPEQRKLSYVHGILKFLK